MRRVRSFDAFFRVDPRLLLRYVGAGALAAVIEFVLFTTLYQRVGWPLLVANCSAFSIAVLFCFVLQKNWTFRVRGGISRQLWLYLFMQAVSAVLNNLLILGFVEGLALYPPLAKILQIAIVFVWNYSFCRLVVFASAPSGAPDSAT